MSKPEDFMFDSRVRDRFLRRRTLSSAEVKRHLDELPDLEGEYEVTETPQPAVTPPRSEVNEEPLVFEGIRRLSALGDGGSGRHAAPPAPSPSVMSSFREPEVRSLGAPLRSALMESEISGVGAGAVSAALGAMAAEARAAVPFVPSVARMPEADPTTPVTLRSEAAPPGMASDDDDSESEMEPEPEPPAPESEESA